ncbi:MAG: hypothetical protein ABW184_14515 [Sphingobium sp.]
MNTRIFKLAFAVAALAGASVASMAQAEDATFQKDGYTYVYNVTEKGNTKHIRGKYYPGNREFALEVRNGRVEGTVNESSVAFPVSSITRSGDSLASAN